MKSFTFVLSFELPKRQEKMSVYLYYTSFVMSSMSDKHLCLSKNRKYLNYTSSLKSLLDNISIDNNDYQRQIK